VRRYGFHGLSYEYIARQLKKVAPEIAAGCVVVAHLGNGSSLCAIRNGRAAATTMGMTPLDGVPMGTRSGQIDPGVLFYLMKVKGMSVNEVSDLIHHNSGLKGMSGVSQDMRELEASDSPSAKEAIDYFVYRIRREIVSLAGALEGLDAIVFTGGIGENSQRTREEVLTGMEWLGVRLDKQANQANAQRISTADSKITVFVLKTNEERMIAGHAVALAGLA
jgi:acetate kinase